MRENEFPTRHDETLKEVYGIKPDLLIHVSNFRKVKRIDTILETFAKVRKTYLVN